MLSYSSHFRRAGRVEVHRGKSIQGRGPLGRSLLLWLIGIGAASGGISCGGGGSGGGVTDSGSMSGGGGGVDGGSGGSTAGVPGAAGGIGAAGGSGNGEGGEGAQGGMAPGSGTGGGGDDGCEGPPVCTPAAPFCDPFLGTLGGCDACGHSVPDPEGEPCIRLLDMAEEYDSFCVVRGQAEVECLDLDSQEVPEGTFRTNVPERTKAIALGDEGFRAYMRYIDLCTWSTTGEARCSFGGDDRYIWAEGECTAASVTHSSTACLLCSGEVDCEGSLFEEPLQGVRAMETGEGNLFVVTAEGVLMNGSSQLVWLTGDYVELAVGNDSFVCARTAAGAIRCAESPERRSIEHKGPYVSVDAGTAPHVCALRPNGSAHCFDARTGESKMVPDEKFVTVVAGRSAACGLTRNGRVLCWDEEGAPKTVPARFGG